MLSGYSVCSGEERFVSANYIVKKNGQADFGFTSSLEDMAHDLILGHNRCFFAYSGRVHPAHEISA